MPRTRSRRAVKPAPPAPQPHWTEQLQGWKLDALSRVLHQMEHICAGPASRPKSFCLAEAVHNVVARDYDPDSQIGTYLSSLLTMSIAHQISLRQDWRARLVATLPHGEPDSTLRYVNSRWWLDNFVHLEGVRCRDLFAAIEAAIGEVKKEIPLGAAVAAAR